MKKLIVMMLVEMLATSVFANSNEIKDVNKPIYGIYLGEPIQKVKERFSNYELDVNVPDTEGVVGYGEIQQKDAVLGIFYATPFEERVGTLYIKFNDASEASYEAVKILLKKKYPDTQWKEEEVLKIKWEFSGLTTIDKVKVFIHLCHKDFIEEELTLAYTHIPLSVKVQEEIQRRKIERYEDNL